MTMIKLKDLLKEDVKIYVKQGVAAPKGKKIQTGPRGGKYFMGTSAEKQAHEKGKGPIKITKADHDRFINQKMPSDPEDKPIKISIPDNVNTGNPYDMSKFVSKNIDKIGKDKTSVEKFLKSKFTPIRPKGNVDVQFKNFKQDFDREYSTLLKNKTKPKGVKLSSDIKKSMSSDWNDYMDNIVDSYEGVQDVEDIVKANKSIKSIINKKFGKNIRYVDEEENEDIANVIDDLKDKKPDFEKTWDDDSDTKMSLKMYGDIAVASYRDWGGSMDTLIVKDKDAQKTRASATKAASQKPTKSDVEKTKASVDKATSQKPTK